MTFSFAVSSYSVALALKFQVSSSSGYRLLALSAVVGDSDRSRGNLLPDYSENLHRVDFTGQLPPEFGFSGSH
ncbi:hypothetical protein AMTR_s00019p00197340 [Amborella trichopoda]|uniref:Uncharacterized protein n=1 Tax=Amborella trichopoda TaxID=13333 RepID=W1PI15_AMBTC|nr:hypothetical protein AMTR_s00019p00197340 [Amborella trichopoda]